MTRRGSLAYYSVAIVLGSVLMTIALWLPAGTPGSHWTPSTRGAAGLLVACCFGLLMGAVPLALFGFALRRISGLWPGLNPLGWMCAGVVSGLTQVFLLGWLAQVLRPHLEGAAGIFAMLLVAGPDVVRNSRWWTVIPVAAITAFFLCRVHYAFDAGDPAAPGSI